MDKTLLLINIIGGIIVIYFYYIYLSDLIEKNISMDKLWANITGGYRNIYILSMLLCVISYLYIIYYLIFIDKEKHTLVLWGSILFFMGAILWTPFLYHYFINNMEKIYIYLALCLTSIGIILLFIYLMNKGNMISKICIGIFLFHILILDNLIWSIKFESI